MKLIYWLMISLLSMGSGNLLAQHFVPIDKSSAVKFTIKNFGFKVEGTFKNLQGDIMFDPSNLKASTFNVTIDATTINTGNNSRDSHLRGEEYFSVNKYAKIRFVSSKIEKFVANNEFKTTGTLTIKDKSKPISISFTAVKEVNTYVFKGQLALNRRDFNVGGDSMVLSDNLSLTINVVAEQQ